MKSTCTCIVLILALSQVALANEPVLQGTSTNVPELTRQSSFIFAGTVQELNATTVPALPASEKTAVVRVDEVLRNAGVVTDIQGKNITVQLSSPGSLKVGEQAVFFTNVAIYGASLAVREVQHINSTSTNSRSQVGQALQQLSDQDLNERLSQADLVVMARVTSVKPSVVRARQPRISEHDPDWWQATIRVESVEKGQSAARLIVVFFPHSDDIRWFASPKFRVGQEGFFLLRRTRDAKLKVDGFTALHPLDFQPKDQQQRIRALTQKIR